jgi:hypothetical protein
VLAQDDDSGNVCIIASQRKKGRNTTVHVWLTPEEAQHVSNRIQSFAKGQHPVPEVVFTQES